MTSDAQGWSVERYLEHWAYRWIALRYHGDRWPTMHLSTSASLTHLVSVFVQSTHCVCVFNSSSVFINAKWLSAYHRADVSSILEKLSFIGAVHTQNWYIFTINSNTDAGCAGKTVRFLENRWTASLETHSPSRASKTYGHNAFLIIHINTTVINSGRAHTTQHRTHCGLWL